MTKIKNEIIWDLSGVFGTWNIFNILSDVDMFKEWLMKEHNISYSKQIFEGHKFILECTYNAFIYELAQSDALGIREGPIFQRANHTGVKLDKIPNCCEKIILLKHISKEFKKIKKAKKEGEMKAAIHKFKTNVLDVFNKIFESEVCINSRVNISKKDLLQKATAFYAYIYLTDFNGLPIGMILNPFTGKMRGALEEEFYMSRYKTFYGYKYALQYLWAKILGKEFKNSKLAKMHKMSDWGYLLDFFDIIREEIILPFENTTNIKFGYDPVITLCEPLSKESFGRLLLPLPEPQLTITDKLDIFFMWYPAEIIDPEKIFSGVPTFISLVIGYIKLAQEYSKDKIIQVCKCIHPNDRGNDYSYGILIERKGVLSDNSGWILFVNCCGDYSGFSGYLYSTVEKYLQKYQRQRLIDISEMVIEKDNLEKYLVKDIREYREKQLRLKVEREKDEILGHARGIIVELLSYYVLSKMGYDLRWNVTLEGKEIDIIAEDDISTKIIECKHNINNIDIKKAISKLKKKAELYNTSKSKNLEFWTWIKPSPEVLGILKDAHINIVLLSESKYLKDKKIDKIRKILGSPGIDDMFDIFDRLDFDEMNFKKFMDELSWREKYE